MAIQLLLSAAYLHTEDRHLGGNNDVTVQINSRDFSVGDTAANNWDKHGKYLRARKKVDMNLVYGFTPSLDVNLFFAI